MGSPLTTLLVLFGVGFLAANLMLARDYVAYLRRRPHALLTWPAPRPRSLMLARVIAAGLAAIIVYKVVVLRWPLAWLFGEAMMLAYYGALYPLSFRVERGFYRDGIWLDRGFARYGDVSGITWRDGLNPTLVVVARHKQRAWHVTVPAGHYGEARRLLRDRIAAHQLHPNASILDLGGHDERDDV